MEKMKHTPGPWAWRLFGDTYTLHADHGRRDTIIGAIPHGQMKYPVVAMSIDGRLKDVDPEHPNAALIAAAPDLLEALEELMRFEASLRMVMFNKLQAPDELFPLMYPEKTSNPPSGYWGCGPEEQMIDGTNWNKEFTPLRQNIVLLMAALNGEL